MAGRSGVGSTSRQAGMAAAQAANMAATRTVMISFKTGNGRQALKGLDALHGKVAELSRDMTWLDAIRKEFRGITLDPARYSVRTTLATAQRRSLREPVGELLKEFKKIQYKYCVHIVDNQNRGEPDSTVGGTSSTFKPGPAPAPPGGGQQQRQQQQRSGQTSRGYTAPPPPPTGGVKRGAETASAGQEVNGSPSSKRTRTRERETSPSSASQSSTETVPLLGNAREQRPPTAVRGGGRGRGGRGGGGTRNTPENMRRFMGEGSGAHTAPPRPPVPPAATTYPEDEMNGGIDDDDDNDDASSQLTTASQSSIDDLNEKGIQVEDFKPVFVENAYSRFSNTDLLRARHDLKELRVHKAQWTKFQMLRR